jgi:hypothetical protein
VLSQAQQQHKRGRNCAADDSQGATAMPATFDDSAQTCAVCGVSVDDGGLCGNCNPFADFPALAALESAAADDYRLRAAAASFAAELSAALASE